MTQPHRVLTGGCLCGGVRFAYEGELGGSLGLVTVCHCGQCRRAQGLASGVAPAQAAGFAVTQGRDLIREYRSSPDKVRAFCGTCGAPLYSLRLRLGALDDPPNDLKVEAHTFTADVPAWAEADEAPRYPGLEPGRNT